MGAEERLDHLVDLSGQRDVLVGDPTLRMSDQSESHCAPTNVDVGMVILAFGEVGHPAHRVDSFEEGAERRRAAQRALGPFPPGQRRRGGVHLVITQYGHTP